MNLEEILGTNNLSAHEVYVKFFVWAALGLLQIETTLFTIRVKILYSGYLENRV